jgi:hypothetical protein
MRRLGNWARVDSNITECLAICARKNNIKLASQKRLVQRASPAAGEQSVPGLTRPWRKSAERLSGYSFLPEVRRVL